MLAFVSGWLFSLYDFDRLRRIPFCKLLEVQFSLKASLRKHKGSCSTEASFFLPTSAIRKAFLAMAGKQLIAQIRP